MLSGRVAISGLTALGKASARRLGGGRLARAFGSSRIRRKPAPQGDLDRNCRLLAVRAPKGVVGSTGVEPYLTGHAWRRHGGWSGRHAPFRRRNVTSPGDRSGADHKVITTWMDRCHHRCRPWPSSSFLRLRNVLGQRTGGERPPYDQAGRDMANW